MAPEVYHAIRSARVSAQGPASRCANAGSSHSWRTATQLFSRPPDTSSAMNFTRSLVVWFACAALGAFFGAARATAQPMGSTLLVPFSSSAQLPSAETRSLEAALQRRRVQLISLHEAHDRFLSRSRVAQTPAASDIDALAKEAHAAIQHVALGRTSAAQSSVQRIVSLAERSLETLNRETATARGLLDACLALVRASLHAGQRDEALDQAMRCRRLVPDLAPSDVAHPATVVGALAEADDQLRRMRVGSLSVSAAPERGCEVYLNGRHLGHTPFALDRAPAGAYRVQVECVGEGPGRVHLVELGDDPVKLTVDASFDGAVQTEPRLALRYAREDGVPGALLSHAVQLGRAVHADDVVLVGMLGGKLTLLRVQAQHERIVAGAQLAEASSANLTRAASTLAEARFDGLDPRNFRPTAVPAAAVLAVGATTTAGGVPKTTENPPRGPKAPDDDPPPPPVPDTKREPSRALLVAGGVVAGLGVAGLGAGFGLYPHWLKLRRAATKGEAGSEMQQAAQADYDAFRFTPLAVGVTGAALLTAAVPLLLPKEPPRSPAAWVGGAIAGAAGVAAIALGASKVGRDFTLRGLLISGGVPLITIPITQLVRAARGPNTSR
jgi:hypothetical protein